MRGGTWIDAAAWVLGLWPGTAFAVEQRPPEQALPPGAVRTIQDAIAAQDKRDPGSRGATPQDDPGRWFGPDEYPPEALRKHEQGRVVARLAVGVDGRVTACTIEGSSGSATLDDASPSDPCSSFTIGSRFNGGAVRAGLPVRSHVVQRFSIATTYDP